MIYFAKGREPVYKSAFSYKEAIILAQADQIKEGYDYEIKEVWLYDWEKRDWRLLPL